MMAELNELTQIQQAVGEYFQTGGGYLSVALVLLGIVAAMAIAIWLSRRQEEAQSETTPSNPRKLFHDLLSELNLTIQQQAMLKAMAADMNMAQPTVMLLSPKIYAHTVKAWHKLNKHSPKTSRKINPQLVVQTLRALFSDNKKGLKH